MTTDDMVLEALREVAKNGKRLEIKGKATRLAEGEGGTCVYGLVSDHLEHAGVDFDLSSFEAAVCSLKGLADVIRRLTDAGFLYPSRTVEHTFWVVMST